MKYSYNEVKIEDGMYYCPEAGCEAKRKDYKALKEHTKKKHGFELEKKPYNRQTIKTKDDYRCKEEGC